MKSNLTKRFGFGAIIFGLALGGVGLWFLLSPAEYRATTRISVGIDDPEIYDPYFIQTEFQIIQSEVVLGKVVEALNLNGEWGKKYAWGKTLTTSETVRLLKRRLNLHLVTNSRFLDISVTDGNPVEAAKIANAIAEAYRDFRINQNRQQILGGIKILKEQYQTEENDIKIKQANLEQLKTQLTLTNPEPVESVLVSNYPSYFQAKQDLSNEEAIHKQRQTIIDSEKSLSVQNAKALVEIVDPAVSPSSPTGPNRLLGAVLLLCGLATSVLGFYLISSGGAVTNSKP
jgi:uncharacterized protein involved in exopolysaccharide biosynthesis